MIDIKFFKLLLSRRSLVIFLLIAQAWFMIYMIWHASIRYSVFGLFSTVLSFLVVLYIVNRSDREGFKLTWIILVLSVPLVGGALYLMFRIQSAARGVRKSMKDSDELGRAALVQNEAVRREIDETCPNWANQIDYLINVPGFPVYKNTESVYLSPGMEYYSSLMAELEKAEKYIFIEVFIIRRGWMWDNLLAALEKKAAAGVDVRLIYDDMGCFLSLPNKYDRMLEQKGIKCVKFNTFRPFWSTLQNNRDHRKIVVIDGKVAFTGGYNFADEYVNKIERFGYWKDSGIMLRGDAAWSFSVLFLEMWESVRHTGEAFDAFRPDSLSRPYEALYTSEYLSPRAGYFQPYADSPIDSENTGEHVYRRIISNARKYVYITTPYLILDDTMLSALRLAAKCGIDIRIITPAIPDKVLVQMTSRSYYRQLLEAGVRIFEYTPGFIHSKLFVSDDVSATVGTANLDFRSLYLHFECGVFIHKSPVITDIKRDFLATQAECREITLDNYKVNLLHRTMQICMRIFAPLM